MYHALRTLSLSLSFFLPLFVSFSLSSNFHHLLLLLAYNYA